MGFWGGQSARASVGSADIVPGIAEKRHQVVHRPLVPTAYALRAHDAGTGHPRSHGEVEDVQRAAETMAEHWCS